MPQFVCPTCGARLYSASPLTQCAWCGTHLASKQAAESETRAGQQSEDDDAADAASDEPKPR
jgi:uncharacterized Zn finger protein (UPF0148 family)